MPRRRTAGTMLFDLAGLLLVLAMVPLSWAFLDTTRPPAVASPSPSQLAPSSQPTAGAASPTPNTGPSQSLGPTFSYGSGAWAKVAPLDRGIWGAGAAILQNGWVLVAGGTVADTSKGAVASAKLIDPSTGGWVPMPDMHEARTYPMLVTLHDGSVLAIGGARNGIPLSSTERFVPDAIGSGTWKPAGTMTDARTHATATVLADGRVLVAGGGITGAPGYRATATAEIYDPATGQWSDAASMSRPRVLHTATLLSTGEVLVTGGSDTYRGPGTVTATAEIYDPVQNVWRAAAPMTAPRYTHSAAALADGRVLVAGGWAYTTDTDPSLSSTEVYDPKADTWKPAGAMRTGRAQFRLAVLPDGRVLAAGGVSPSYDVLADCGLFDPKTGQWSPTGDLPQPVMWPVMVTLQDGRVLLLGGAMTASAGKQSSMVAIYAAAPPK